MHVTQYVDNITLHWGGGGGRRSKKNFPVFINDLVDAQMHAEVTALPMTYMFSAESELAEIIHINRLRLQVYCSVEEIGICGSQRFVTPQ